MSVCRSLGITTRYVAALEPTPFDKPLNAARPYTPFTPKESQRRVQSLRSKLTVSKPVPLKIETDSDGEGDGDGDGDGDGKKENGPRKKRKRSGAATAKKPPRKKTKDAKDSEITPPGGAKNRASPKSGSSATVSAEALVPPHSWAEVFHKEDERWIGTSSLSLSHLR